MSGVYPALRKRFKEPEWGLLFEVHNRTGWGQSRSADALAMSLWPSRGLTLEGIEIKEDRGDWLRELRAPAKSAPIQEYCDRWWVAAARGVVRLDVDNFPETWGLLVVEGSRLVRKIEAPKLEAKPLDRAFLAAVFRRLAEAQEGWVARSEIAEELTKAREEGAEREKSSHSYEITRLKRVGDDANKLIAEFEREAGVKISRYQAGDCGKYFRAAQLLDDLESRVRRLSGMEQQMSSIVEGIGRVREELA